MTRQEAFGLVMGGGYKSFNSETASYTVAFAAHGTYCLTAIAYLASGGYAISEAALSYSYTNAEALGTEGGVVTVSASAGGTVTVTASNPSGYRGYFVISVSGHAPVSIS